MTPWPVWLEPIDLEEWPTQTVESATLHYTLPIRVGWSTVPQVNESPVQVEHVFQGVYPSEWLVVSFMDKADPAANLRNWAEAVVNLTGFPITSMSQAAQPPKLLEWQYEGACAPLAERLGVDEVHLYRGLGMLPGRPPELARFYILLARRGTLAWKIGLSFMSACLPGTDEAVVAENDHVRAGATFGYSRLS